MTSGVGPVDVMYRLMFASLIGVWSPTALARTRLSSIVAMFLGRNPVGAAVVYCTMFNLPRTSCSKIPQDVRVNFVDQGYHS